MFKNKELFFLLLIAFISFALYFPSVFNDFNLDDELVYTNNHSLTEIFTNYSFSSENYNFGYRPIVKLTFFLEEKLAGNNPFTGHLINILLYVFLSILVFKTLRLMDFSAEIAFWSTLIFVTHPLHSEVVLSIKNRDELLVGIFGFSSFILLLSSRKTYLTYLGIFTLWLSGFLTKESFVLFPIIIFFYYIFTIYNKKNISTSIIPIIILSIVSFSSYIFLKSKLIDANEIIRTFDYFENPLYLSQSVSERILPAFGTIAYYLKHILLPVNISYYYGYNTINYLHFLAVFTGIVFIIICVYLLFRLSSKKYKIALFILLINLIFISNFFQVLPGIIADRFIFTGILGFSLLVVLFIFKTSFPYRYILIGIISMGYILKDISRLSDWKNEYTLYTHDVKHHPESAKMNEMLASYYLKNYHQTQQTGYLDSSEVYFLQAIKIYPQYDACLNNLGVINIYNHKYKKALSYFNKIKTTDKRVLNENKILCYEQLNYPDSSFIIYTQLLQQYPNEITLLSKLKLFCKNHNKTSELIDFIEQTPELADNFNIQLLLVDLNQMISDDKKTIFYLKKLYNKTKDKKYLSYIEILEKK